ncbi:outer membrane protein assembly factor BamC [Pigmentiphaga sp.]|uniref:outer membrane protein assembly factor BamC n=1 Tax=Pigmentiphaga sp. TaxID=1977564 RepID=UPI00128D60AA|nr:outer membrane protein assembly factor BamC [Pigmentiphaga sp.]MPS26808.1 outer membrane protein assembly factor BamC [Alcaligenaceae bacterium SAGV5]MPS53833.1 outer membrane protein assembly factor BamC [Alcaligenaceae bacterium SAGV3]MPT60235.1 outer membrane protein assembly factor BamC [Alcaligenaceae bacterium]
MNAVRMSFPRLAVLPVLVSLSALFAGCSSVNQLLGKEESIDYKSASKPATAKLEVPPDLTQLPTDNRFQVPSQTSSGSTPPAPSTATFSSYSTVQPETRPAASNVLPERSDMRVERDGDQRWLVVIDRSPEQLYPVVRQFWQDLGFLMREDLPQAGVMETDWAENRAKIPQDFIRNTVGKVFDSLWSTGERDMFRTRLERVGNSTEIYISHRGAVEVLTGAEKSQTTWTTRPNDPGLEAEMLSRLMIRLGADFDRAKVAVANATPVAAGAAPQLVSGSGDSGALQIAEPFDRAWRRVGLALDRGGFTVEDRNRAEGVYYVRYVDTDAANSDSKPGFFGRLFGRGGDKPETRPQYRVKLVTSNDRTQVTVLNAQGAPENTPTGRRILNVLSNQLK